MLFIKRLILFIIFFVLGVLIVKYREKIVRIIGKNDLAEKYLGMGGTYNMWVIIGIISMFIGAMILLGKCSYLPGLYL